MRLREIVLERTPSIEAAETAQSALNRLRTLDASSLIVWKGKKVAGVVSEAQLAGLTQDERTRRSAGDAATPVDALRGDDTIKDAANVMRAKGIDCVPVLEDGKLIGVVTVDRLLELIGRGAIHAAPAGERRVLKSRGGVPRRLASHTNPKSPSG